MHSIPERIHEVSRPSWRRFDAVPRLLGSDEGIPLPFFLHLHINSRISLVSLKECQRYQGSPGKTIILSRTLFLSVFSSSDTLNIGHWNIRCNLLLPSLILSSTLPPCSCSTSKVTFDWAPVELLLLSYVTFLLHQSNKIEHQETRICPFFDACLTWDESSSSSSTDDSLSSCLIIDPSARSAIHLVGHGQVDLLPFPSGASLCGSVHLPQPTSEVSKWTHPLVCLVSHVAGQTSLDSPSVLRDIGGSQPVPCALLLYILLEDDGVPVTSALVERSGWSGRSRTAR